MFHVCNESNKRLYHFFSSFDFSIATFGPLLSKTASFTRHYSLRFTIDFWLKDQWESRNKVGSLNSGEHQVRFESENFSIYCNTLTHWSALLISAIRAVYVLPNLGTLSNSFKLFPLAIIFWRSVSLRSSITSAYYCTAHYTTISVSLGLFLSTMAISALVSLSYVFNFSLPQISVNLKSVCRLLPLVWLFYYNTNLSFKRKYPKDTSNNYFHINNHNLNHFLLLSIFELRKNKTRPF